MKKIIALTLVTLLFVVSFMGCGKDDAGDQASKPWPNDVFEGQSYVFVQHNNKTGKNILPQYLEGMPEDKGRIKDGMFRTEDELKQDLGDDKIILLKGGSSFENIITFQNEKAYEIFAVVIHNTRQTTGNCLKVRKIEIGDTIDTLKEIQFKDQTQEVGVGDLIHNISSFEPTSGKAIRVTFDSDGQSICTLEEVSVIGYPAGEGEHWLPKGWKPGKDLPEHLLK